MGVKQMAGASAVSKRPVHILIGDEPASGLPGPLFTPSLMIIRSGEGGASIAQLQLEPGSVQTVFQACAGDADAVRVTPREGGAAATAAAAAAASQESVALVCKKCRLCFQSEQAMSFHVRNCGGRALPGEAEPPKRPPDPPPPATSPSAGLSHEMEDVVNQITALAAQAQQQAHDNSDSNANLFCPPPEPKKSKLFTAPTGVAVPSTGQ